MLLCFKLKGVNLFSISKTHFICTSAKKTNINQKAYYHIYNSDGHMGPFYDTVEYEEYAKFYEDDKTPTGDLSSEDGENDVYDMDMEIQEEDSGDVGKFVDILEDDQQANIREFGEEVSEGKIKGIMTLR